MMIYALNTIDLRRQHAFLGSYKLKFRRLLGMPEIETKDLYIALSVIGIEPVGSYNLNGKDYTVYSKPDLDGLCRNIYALGTLRRFIANKLRSEAEAKAKKAANDALQQQIVFPENTNRLLQVQEMFLEELKRRGF